MLIKKAQDGYKSNPYATMAQARKTKKTVKKLTKQEQNTKDATTGNGVNSRPVFKGPNSGPRAKTTLGGAKNGKSISKAKNGKSFPDLNKDGKITKADVLKGRGVIAKSGTSMKKCKYGCN